MARRWAGTVILPYYILSHLTYAYLSEVHRLKVM